MDLLWQRIVMKLFKRETQRIIVIVQSSNIYRNLNTSYKLRSIIAKPSHKHITDLNSVKECILFRHILNKYRPMCTVSLPHINCWKCGEKFETVQIFCDKCKSLQKVNKNSNYFEIIGVDKAYDLNLSELSAKYRKLQSVLHPDKFGNKTEEERLISEQYSARVNKAYSTLLHPVERGLYMLKLNGLQIDEESVHMDKSFLMEIMEINEEIENENDPQSLNKLNETNKKSLNSLIRQLTDAFKKDDIKTAKEILTKMKYYASIEEKIKVLKQKRGIPD